MLTKTVHCPYMCSKGTNLSERYEAKPYIDRHFGIHYYLSSMFDTLLYPVYSVEKRDNYVYV